jgi:hypothetical protein
MPPPPPDHLSFSVGNIDALSLRRRHLRAPHAPFDSKHKTFLIILEGVEIQILGWAEKGDRVVFA